MYLLYLNPEQKVHLASQFGLYGLGSLGMGRICIILLIYRVLLAIQEKIHLFFKWMQTLLPQLSYLPNISPKYPIHHSTSVMLDSLQVWFMAPNHSVRSSLSPIVQQRISGF